MSEQALDWNDQRVRTLYSLAVTSRDGVIRHEVLTILGAMERAGSKDAESALDTLKKRGLPR
jgi:hypothetical protein